jgi:hypothetical protein
MPDSLTPGSEIHTFPTGERELRLTDSDPAFPAKLKLGPHPVRGFQAQVSMTVNGELQGAGVYLTTDQIRDLRDWCNHLLKES